MLENTTTAWREDYTPACFFTLKLTIKRREFKKWQISNHACSKLVRCDAKRLDLQSECVEREGRLHSQNLLWIAHVGAAHRTPKIVETVVAGWEGSWGEKDPNFSNYSKSEKRNEKKKKKKKLVVDHRWHTGHIGPVSLQIYPAQAVLVGCWVLWTRGRVDWMLHLCKQKTQKFI